VVYPGAAGRGSPAWVACNTSEVELVQSVPADPCLFRGQWDHCDPKEGNGPNDARDSVPGLVVGRQWKVAPKLTTELGPATRLTCAFEVTVHRRRSLAWTCSIGRALALRRRRPAAAMVAPSIRGPGGIARPPRPVKPATRKSFTAGLTINPRRAPFTAADLAWAAASLNARTTQYEVTGRSDAALEQAASCAFAQARLDAGFPLF